MACNNAAEVNVECEKATPMSLLDLHDFALLQVFGYLNLRDSIHFAGTSKRLKSVGVLHFTKYKRLDLAKYAKYEKCQQPNKLPAEIILSHIGQHIKTLSIYSMPSTTVKAAMNNCVNVTTLKIYDCKVTRKLKKWMQQLKLESLTIKRCSHLNKMSVRLEELKGLHFSDGIGGLTSMQLTNILEKTTELETFTVNLTLCPNFNFDIFTKLTKLQCLNIEINSSELTILAGVLKMDGLTRFICFIDNLIDEGLQRVNSFLEILAERSKLNELKLDTYTVDQNTFGILKSFHDITSLGFYAANVELQSDERWMIDQLANAQPNLKHLEVLYNDLLIEEVDLVVKNFAKLERFTFCMNLEDLEKLNELQINEMLKTSTSRPMLTLYINSDFDKEPRLRFEQRKYRIVQLDMADDSYFLTDRFTV